MLMELSNVLGNLPIIIKIIVVALTSCSIIAWQRKLYFKHKDDNEEHEN